LLNELKPDKQKKKINKRNNQDSTVLGDSIVIPERQKQ